MARRKGGTGLSSDADEARRQILGAAESARRPGSPAPRCIGISGTATRC